MKDRQRWQPEEDALLRAYVKQYGPKEWNFITQRMGKPLDRDPKSCLERWKNYLKPGIKKGSLSPEEQSLVISLQAKYGNKWKKIAAEVPGRTAKRLGKWWEVFKEKQIKKSMKNHPAGIAAAAASPENSAGGGKYDHILETFAEKYVVVQPKAFAFPTEPPPVLSLGLNMNATPTATSSLTSSSSLSDSPSVEPPVHEMGGLVRYCIELEEGKESWVRHKKEASWRLSRLEQQLESEKGRRRREKMDEIESRVRLLRDEESEFLRRMEVEYKERLGAMQRDAEVKEAELMEAWCGQHARLARLVERMGGVNTMNGFGGVNQ